MTEHDTMFTAGGGALKRFRRIAGTYADEYQLNVTESGITVNVVDPANVAHIQARLDPEITGRINRDELPETIGVNDGVLQRAVAPAQKGRGNDHGDDVDVTYKANLRRLAVAVDAERDGYNIEHETTFSIIDPDSMRDDAEKPEITLPATARLSRKAFMELTGSLTDPEAVTVGADGEALLLKTPTERDGYTKRVPNRVDSDDEDTTYETMVDAGYLRDIRTTIKKTKPEKVTLAFGSEFPTRVGFEFPDLGVDATATIAPRIASS